MPKVSVIITTYNYGQYIIEAIRSVLNQTFEDFEVIIVDDGSSDKTYEIVSHMMDERIEYLYQENRGVSYARNAGLDVSRGQYICFLDADDLWLPWKLAVQIKTIEAYPLAGIIYADMFLINVDGSKILGLFLSQTKREPPHGKVLDKLVDRFFGYPSTLMIKREVFDKVGKFDETLKNCQDYDWLLRAAGQFEFEVVTLPLTKYRIHAGQLSRNKASVLDCQIACFNRTLKSPAITPLIRQKLLTRLAKFHFNKSLHAIKRHDLLNAGRELRASLKR
jgi:glycosyltransferase involved in cell wall biosynthesis